jgi:hypothetical protein
MNSDLSRRQFLHHSATAAALGLAAPLAGAAESASDGPSLKVMLRDPSGSPLADRNVKSMVVRDLAGDPLPQSIRHGEAESYVALPPEPVQLSCLLAVPGFGEVHCCADNGGHGYSSGHVDFVVDAARTRLRRVREKFKRDGAAVRGDPEFERHLSAAARAIPSQPIQARMAVAYECLAHGLHAGERLTLLSARLRIARLPRPRHEFLFGGLTAGHDRSPEFARLFLQAFNFGTMSWYYWGKTDAEADLIHYERMDESLQWCEANHLVPKGYGYIYLAKGATPEWLRALPYDKVLPIYKRVVEQTMRRYAGRVPYAEIINEAHDKTNLFRFNHEQLLELTREGCAAARRGAPHVIRQINNCCLWGEYAKNRNPDGSRKWTPWRYLDDCVKSNAEFECIGLQLYYPAYDLFEIERMLDRFTVFGKRLHISEISCNSAPGLDPESMLAKDDVAGWHGPWTESMQADWLEGMYTICYSKPEFEAINWWDVDQAPGHFWPYGGLLRKDYTPKEAYFRLLTLKKNWGLA